MSNTPTDAPAASRRRMSSTIAARFIRPVKVSCSARLRSSSPDSARSVMSIATPRCHSRPCSPGTRPTTSRIQSHRPSACRIRMVRSTRVPSAGSSAASSGWSSGWTRLPGYRAANSLRSWPVTSSVGPMRWRSRPGGRVGLPHDRGDAVGHVVELVHRHAFVRAQPLAVGSDGQGDRHDHRHRRARRHRRRCVRPRGRAPRPSATMMAR